ncbi:MAG: SPASM domain-containing protein, partial [Desulfovibrio sp.]|nr:SPASM domain-containing protein [Desulfovibrio sp.]
RRVFGDIRRADPLKIWASPAFAAFRDAQAHGQPDAPCASCPKRFERLH